MPPDPENSEDAIVTVAKHAGFDRQYEIKWHQRDQQDASYRAVASSVRGSTFLDVGDADDAHTPGGWAFFRYSMLRENVVYVETVPERFFTQTEASPSVSAGRAPPEQALEATPDALEVFCLCVKKAK